MSRAGISLAVLFAALSLSSPAAAASLLPRVPTQFVGARALEVRPPVISWTGDGTGYLGGFTGHPSVRIPSRSRVHWAGQIRWTEWTSARARGKGAVWLNNGIPDDAQGTFFAYAMTVRLFGPANGVFTRMTIRFRYQGKAYTDKLHAVYTPPSSLGPGYWSWA